jgi:hypothetical protein
MDRRLPDELMAELSDALDELRAVWAEVNTGPIGLTTTELGDRCDAAEQRFVRAENGLRAHVGWAPIERMSDINPRPEK